MYGIKQIKESFYFASSLRNTSRVPAELLRSTDYRTGRISSNQRIILSGYFLYNII